MSENTQEQNSSEQEQKVFTEDYVKQLREEAKANRLKHAEAEAKFNELSKQIEESKTKEQAEQGKFKELYEQEQEKLKKLEADAESFKQYKDKFEKLENEIREELLSKLTDNHKAIAKDLDVTKLKTYVELNSVTHNYDTARTGGLTFSTEGKNWTDFSSEELEEINKKSPNTFKKLYENYLKTKK